MPVLNLLEQIPRNPAVVQHLPPKAIPQLGSQRPALRRLLAMGQVEAQIMWYVHYLPPLKR